MTKYSIISIRDQCLGTNLEIKPRIHGIIDNEWWTTIDLKWIVDFIWKATSSLVLEHHGERNNVMECYPHGTCPW